MIVTRRWLEDFINLDGVTDDELCKVFNSIGLEVSSVRKLEIPEKVVVGKIIICQKHPNADRLNLCQVDVGDGVLKQIVCGADNVSESLYVAVALEGAVLPAINLTIEQVTLRGIDSYGMICSSSELGLPEMGDGIMALDSSIGDLVIGKELKSYPKLNDTIIELELTPNRGDCLNIYGVARDLSVYFDKSLKGFEYKPKKFMVQGIARAISLKCVPLKGVKLLFNVADAGEIKGNFLTKFRLSLIDKYCKDDLTANIRYTLHTTGVVIRVYDFDKIKDCDNKVHLNVEYERENIVKIESSKGLLSYVGISSDKNSEATSKSKKLLIEVSYIDPVMLAKATYKDKSMRKDELYYYTLRGTNPNLFFGLSFFYRGCDMEGICEFGELPIKVEGKMPKKVVNVDIRKLNAIFGVDIPRQKINNILKRLGITTYGSNSQDVFGATIPEWRHDMENVQDIAEEILRIIGIDSIEAKPLTIIEQNRFNELNFKIKAIRDLRIRASSHGFFEVITYAFTSKDKLLRYGFTNKDKLLQEVFISEDKESFSQSFDIVDDKFDLVNPIVEELNAMRTTMAINLLDAVVRNTKYGKKKISLFEIGTVFNKDREETNKIIFVHSGFIKEPNIMNRGKPKMVDFGLFVESLSSILGEFKLKQVSPEELFFHPYIYARVYISGVDVGYIGRLNPSIQEELNLFDTFIAEIDLEATFPKHKNASSISNFQGVFKDLSVLINKYVTYSQISNAIKVVQKNNPLIKRFFIIDLYEDESLGDKKSLTIRLFLQSDKSTLSDSEIEDTVNQVLDYLSISCGAELR